MVFKRKNQTGYKGSTKTTRKFGKHTLKYQGGTKKKSEAKAAAKRYKNKGAAHVRVTKLHYEGKHVGYGVWASK